MAYHHNGTLSIADTAFPAFILSLSFTLLPLTFNVRGNEPSAKRDDHPPWMQPLHTSFVSLALPRSLRVGGGLISNVSTSASVLSPISTRSNGSPHPCLNILCVPSSSSRLGPCCSDPTHPLSCRETLYYESIAYRSALPSGEELPLWIWHRFKGCPHTLASLPVACLSGEGLQYIASWWSALSRENNVSLLFRETNEGCRGGRSESRRGERRDGPVVFSAPSSPEKHESATQPKIG
ncbi:uncharacterized protein EV420DRAFT_1019132 [Desarmillaria tabescens]|uniref:Uncharacterized protein n=1 Tax=Armillaria tabescens TaxID=1929756 RepID=A0AA39JJV8_ARMTA|nr:uncharacterized protein EV420DRAFT_1019132 [Desarmillaria tabescens]KAK0443993.1 hypothetical protein EV420DRAFT_1019132 [Desarmillaria tabescens]